MSNPYQQPSSEPQPNTMAGQGIPQQQPPQPQYAQQPNPYQPTTDQYQQFPQNMYPQQPMQPPVQYKREPKWNGMAIAGFVLSFVFSVIGLVLSIIAFIQIKETGEKGRGLALAGIIISAIVIGTMLMGLADGRTVLGSMISDLNDYSYYTSTSL